MSTYLYQTSMGHAVAAHRERPALDAERDDVYHWAAVLRPHGGVVNEFEADGSFKGFRYAFTEGGHTYDEIAMLVLLPQRQGYAMARVELRGDERPIFFRRGRTHLPMFGTAVALESQRVDPYITVIGWQRTVGGVNVQSLAAYYGDGSSLITSDINSI